MAQSDTQIPNHSSDDVASRVLYHSSTSPTIHHHIIHMRWSTSRILYHSVVSRFSNQKLPRNDIRSSGWEWNSIGWFCFSSYTAGCHFLHTPIIPVRVDMLPNHQIVTMDNATCAHVTVQKYLKAQFLLLLLFTCYGNSNSDNNISMESMRKGLTQISIRGNSISRNWVE